MKKILVVIAFLICASFHPDDKTYTFTLTADELNKVVIGLQGSTTLSAADVNNLLKTLEAQIQSQIDSVNVGK